MVLINSSKDKWSVSTGQKISANEEIKLGEKPLTIVFSPGVKGTLKPAADVPPAGGTAAGSDTP